MRTRLAEGLPTVASIFGGSSQNGTPTITAYLLCSLIRTMHSAAVLANKTPGQGCHNVTCVRIVHREGKEHWAAQIASKLIQAKIVVA